MKRLRVTADGDTMRNNLISFIDCPLQKTFCFIYFLSGGEAKLNIWPPKKTQFQAMGIYFHFFLYITR